MDLSMAKWELQSLSHSHINDTSTLGSRCHKTWNSIVTAKNLQFQDKAL